MTQPAELSEGADHQPTCAACAEEQPVVDRLFARLDRQRLEAAHRRDQMLRTAPVGTPQARAERDAFVALYQDQLRRLQAIDDGLVFGRLDRIDGCRVDAADADCQKVASATVRTYIGRVGLRDEQHRQLLVDWRAPAAEDFYRATAANPAGVRLRRHLRVRNRAVVAVHDDLLAASGNPALDASPASPMVGEAALLAAVNEARDGRMRDIVVTLQADQDRIIRSPLRGVLVVQGAPGTGKTAVALHRAGYLLYTHRERLAASGVLLLGPSDQFLRYIEDVLPSLGETSVVSATLADLYPGADVRLPESPDAAAVKGDLRMVQVLRRAVELRQRTPRTTIPLTVEDTTLQLRPAVVRAARRAAQRTGEPHNQAREEFCRLVLDDLLDQLATATGEPLDQVGQLELLRTLHAALDVRREVNLCWMPLQPERLLARLWRDPDALAEAADGVLTSAEQGALLRPEEQQGWSAGDIPLLDKLAELIGDQPASVATRAARRRQTEESAEQLRFAEESLTSLGLEGSISAELLASRYRAAAGTSDVAQRAAADRDWAYGHVVVDEAQELSQMAWRMVVRRCPSRSMTVVGDVAQTTSSTGAVSWSEVFDVHAPGGWRLEQLMVNYRTPATVMQLAARATRVPGAAGASNPDAAAVAQLRSLRPGSRPVAVRVTAVGGRMLARIASDPRLVHPQGTVAVIVADYGACHNETGTRGHAESPLDRLRADGGCVPVLTAVEAKGLEFDTVVVVEPAAYLDLGEPGRRQLYVALTRPTQRLVVVHRRPLPDGFAGLVDEHDFKVVEPAR